MMKSIKIAIVGTSKPLAETEEMDVRKVCTYILNTNDRHTLISGGAKGIDFIAYEVAKELSLKTIIYDTAGPSWEHYKKRNMAIAKNCDELYCITTKVKTEKCYHHKEPMDHQKTAGCWTMNEAKLLNKHTKLVIL